MQVEADLGYPGGKAKIIHKESDMIMAFSINKVKALVIIKNVVLFSEIDWIIDSAFALQANYNEIVLASTHDVQELDVTSLLACQSYMWIGEEYDRESKRLDCVT